MSTPDMQNGGNVPWTIRDVPWTLRGGNSCDSPDNGTGCGICVPGRYGNLPTPGPNVSTCPGSTNIPIPGLPPGCPGFS